MEKVMQLSHAIEVKGICVIGTDQKKPDQTGQLFVFEIHFIIVLKVRIVSK